MELKAEITKERPSLIYLARTIEISLDGKSKFRFDCSPYINCCGAIILNNFVQMGTYSLEEESKLKSSILDIINSIKEAQDRVGASGASCVIIMDEENGAGKRFFGDVLGIPPADAYVNFNTNHNIFTYILKI